MSSQINTKESLAAKIVSLNEQFLQWVQTQDKSSLWLDGIEDYREYAESISKELKEIDARAGEASAAAEPKPLFNFNPSSQATPATGAPQSTGFGGFSATPVASHKSSEVVVLGGNDENGGDGGNNEETEGNVEEDGDQLQVDGGSTADVLFSKKVHLLSQDPETKKWKDKGTGTFSLRKSKDSGDGKRVSFIVFTSATGKVLINAPVIKGMKPMVNAKSPSNVIMFLISIEEVAVEGQENRTEEKKQMHLFKCGSVEVANELTSAVSAEA